MGSATMHRRLGASCGSWDGVASAPPDAPWNGMKKRSGGGSRSAGPRLKKSPERRPHHRLHRRKRIERAAAPLSHLGTERADAGAAISFYLEDAIGDGGGDLVEFLFPAVSGSDPQPADHRVSHASAAPYSRQATDCLGRFAGSS